MYLLYNIILNCQYYLLLFYNIFIYFLISSFPLSVGNNVKVVIERNTQTAPEVYTPGALYHLCLSENKVYKTVFKLSQQERPAQLQDER